MSVVLDASMALAWLIRRTDPAEAILAGLGSVEVRVNGAVVPSLFYAEVGNTLLVFERTNRLTEQQTSTYLFDLTVASLTEDSSPASLFLPRILDLGRRYRLSAYDATYLELALRTASTLATFDRKLAEAARSAGVPVFGDTALTG